MKKILLLIVVIPLAAQYSYSQSKHGLAIRRVNSNHQFPLSNNFDFNDFATAGLEIEYYRSLNKHLSLSLPFRIQGSNLPIDELGRYHNAGTASLDLLLNLKLFKQSNFLYPYLYLGVSGISENLQKEFSFAAPAGVGLNFKINQNTYLTTKSEYRFGFKNLRNNLQFAVGFLIHLGQEVTEPQKKDNDRDKDGVMNSEDLCPDLAGVVALNGCPDTDSDGIIDGDDECPTLAGTTALKGCPDTDKDGIADQKDDCPDKSGPISNNGCPLATDTDKDGVPDTNDDCPNKTGSSATNGCPDSDSDGILDKDDKCPYAPGLVANNGCPKITKEDRETLISAMQGVQFETARDILKSESNAILDKVADIMKRNTSYKLAIKGHTDSVGHRTDNLKLSEKRAKACYDYLISKGISARRLNYQGYGESAPIADNKLKSGREKNRRVEFTLYVE